MGRTFEREEDLQGAAAELFAAVLSPSVLYFHTPNGAAWKRSKSIAGVLVGVPDWYLSWANPADFNQSLLSVTGWIELKSASGRVTAEQSIFKRRARDLSHFWGSTGTIEGVIAYLKDWHVPLRVKL